MERSPFVLVLLAFGAAAALMFTLPNLSNVRVTAGYASYVYSRPIAGRSEFKQVLFGPASTGLSWRLDAQRVSITPFTYSEKFESENAIIGKDKLPLSSQAHIVWRGIMDTRRSSRSRWVGNDPEQANVHGGLAVTQSKQAHALGPRLGKAERTG